jgi:coenzyme Q-binding protein COQ10
MVETVIEAQRSLPYPAEALCRMVGDVRRYPQFIPWIRSLRLLREQPLEGGGWEGVAEAVVGWKAITERFATKVRSDPARGSVEVDLVSGPFRSLKNHWRFQERSDGGADVAFFIRYEFRNPLLNALVRANQHRAADKIMQAFEAEAQRRFGGAVAAQ